MIEQFRWLAGLIAAYPGRKIEGGMRLQKSIYLLQRTGFPTDYEYSLHFNGPISEGLGMEILLVIHMGLVTEESHNLRESKSTTWRAEDLAVMPEIEKYRVWIDAVAQAEVVVLDLAATYEGFRQMGYNHSDAIARTQRKKSNLWSPENQAKMLTLLAQLRLLDEEANVA